VIRFTLAFLLLVLPFRPIALAGDPLADLLEGIQKKYGQLPGLTITYTREVITRSMSMLGSQVRGDLATGRIYFAPPHFLRLEQEAPNAETIVSNGKTLWWYIPAKKEVHQFASREFGKELTLLGDIFRGLSKVEERFQVALVGRNQQGEFQMELRPNPPWQDIERIVLTVTPEHDIRVVDIHNVLGSITRFGLEDQKKTKNFKKNFFEFVVPQGVHLIEEGG